MTPLLGLLRTTPATSKSVPLDTMETYLTMWTPLALVYVQEAITVSGGHPCRFPVLWARVWESRETHQGKAAPLVALASSTISLELLNVTAAPPAASTRKRNRPPAPHVPKAVSAHAVSWRYSPSLISQVAVSLFTLRLRLPSDPSYPTLHLLVALPALRKAECCPEM